MDALELTARLTAFERRGPGTDAERRAARWLVGELSGGGHRPAIEPFWCRPNWALAHSWHIALALAGSLVSVSQPTVGVVLLAFALVSIVADDLTGVSLGRRLTPERASQNVVLDGPPDKPTRLIVTAGYDAARAALIYRSSLRRAAATLRRAAGPFALGWLGCLSIAIVWLLAIAIIRMTVHNPPSILGAIQLPPSVALVLTLALLLEAAGAGYGRATDNAGPSATDNASATAVAIALLRALQTSPPRNMSVDLVLQGAGAGHEIGLRRYLKRHRADVGAERTIVLGIAPSAGEDSHWWRSDGRLLPIAYTRRLAGLAHDAAGDRVLPHRGRGSTPALPARLRAQPLPAITIGHGSIDRTVELGILLVDAIDAALDADRSRDRNATPTEPTATPA